MNRYVIVHGEQRELVLYWYQSRDRVVADEFKAKFWVVADAMRLNRTDTALVRVIGHIDNNNEEAATSIATDFVRSFFGTLRQLSAGLALEVGQPNRADTSQLSLCAP